jgi:MFS family permease
MVRDVTTYRRALIPLAAAALMGAFWGAWAALVPEIQLRTGASPAELGGALLWVGVGAVPAMLLTGRLWARFGRRLVGATLFCFGLAATLPALAPDVVVLGFGLALAGASSGALDVSMNAEISDIEAQTGRRLMYLLHALFSLAMLTTSLATGMLRELGSEPLPILGALAVGFVLVSLPALLRLQTARRRVPSPVTASGVRPRLRGTLILLGLLCALAFGIEDALTSWSALHLERTLGASPAVGGAGPGMFAAAMFIGRSLGQVVGHRWTDRDILLGAGSLASVGILVAAWAPAPEPALAGLFVAGGGVALAAPALFGRAGRLAGEAKRGSAMSTLTVLGYVGFIIGPAMMGTIASAFDLRLSFTALALLALAMAAIARLTISDPAAPVAETDLPPVVRG